ncbi:MAG: VCBS repeat-containing protein [Verrucomicrobia subdivision 3 bacterium]|nr:VCBS repeat-containing protein [Limisphaerales bacterium]
MSDRLQKYIVIIFGIATVTMVLWTQREAIHDLTEPEVPEKQPANLDERVEQLLARGEVLTQQHCVACHTLPTPEMLDRGAWDLTLARMLPWVGLVPPGTGLSNTNGFDRVLAAGLYPPKPLMPDQDWKLIHSYFLTKAPRHLPRPSGVKFVGSQKTFAAITPDAPFDASCIAVRVQPNTGGLWATHYPTKTVHRMTPELNWQTPAIKLGGSPVEMRFTSDGMVGALIGSFMPSFEQNGALIRWRDGKANTLAASLYRPTDVLPVDLNGDGREDLVVCEYGHYTGSVFWLENKGDTFERHTLLDMPGCLNAASADFNGDQRPDLVILTAQAREAVYLLLNLGDNHFEPSMLLPRQPMWGHSHIETYDFNNDTHPDLLITNGDNGELNPALSRPYHGVRVHLNDGKNNFTKELFFSQPGAYKALAADFDSDGDLDIASIAFFADYKLNPHAGFIYLRQDAALKFSAHSLPEADRGRWITLDAGDVDRDQDIDLVLGAHNMPQRQIPDALRKRWAEKPTPILILKNLTK